MSEIGGSSRRWPVRTPGAHIERRGDRAVISDANGGPVLAVNSSAAALWELCDGRTAVDEMVTAVCELTSISSEQARAQVGNTIGLFEQAGLIKVEHGQPPSVK